MFAGMYVRVAVFVAVIFMLTFNVVKLLIHILLTRLKLPSA